VAGDHIAVSALALFSEPLDETGTVGDLALAFGKRLALLAAEQLAQRVLMFHHEIEQLAHQPGAFAGGLRTPCRQCSFGRVNRACGFRLAHLGDSAEHLARAGIDHLKCCAAIGIAPFAVDIALLLQEIGVAHRVMSPFLAPGPAGPLPSSGSQTRI